MPFDFWFTCFLNIAPLDWIKHDHHKKHARVAYIMPLFHDMVKSCISIAKYRIIQSIIIYKDLDN